ncbi:hypothetical protein C8R43DRAFT_1080647 [Mycena crocata]|nr:hypothetical protein C8R43DRAFT_1080647 [Mycena crocata]
MVAIKEAVVEVLEDMPLEIHSDSRVSIDGLTKNLKRWEDGGFFEVENRDLVRKTITDLRRRKAKTSFKWIKGHAGNPGNEAADALADQGSAKVTPDRVDMKTHAAFMLPGAKLQALTQSSAYKIIRKIKVNQKAYQKKLDRKATRVNIAFAKAAAAGDDDESTPLEGRIWKSTKHKDVSRSIRFFLWMLIHDGYKVGSYWEKIPDYEDWAPCEKCGITESMEHILTRCEFPGQREIWKMASDLWKLKTGETLPRPVMGQIMSCAMAKQRDAGATRLYRIMVSESAHLIWRIRNERKIKGWDPATPREARNRWLRAINNRLKIDCIMTNEVKFGKKAIQKKLVKETWKNVLKDESTLPKDWTWETEVLVGIG